MTSLLESLFLPSMSDALIDNKVFNELTIVVMIYNYSCIKLLYQFDLCLILYVVDCDNLMREINLTFLLSIKVKFKNVITFPLVLLRYKQLLL